MMKNNRAMEWFYDIAINLRKLNNYHSVMGFVVGFNISGINRLKHTIDSVDRQLIKVLFFISLFPILKIEINQQVNSNLQQ